MQLQKGQNYLELKPLIMIVILNYAPDNIPDNQCLENIITVNKNFRDIQIEMGIRFIFIYTKGIKDEDALKPENTLYQWLKFIEYKNLEVIDMINNINTDTKKATEELEKINADREAKRIAEIYENGELASRL